MGLVVQACNPRAQEADTGIMSSSRLSTNSRSSSITYWDPVVMNEIKKVYDIYYK